MFGGQLRRRVAAGRRSWDCRIRRGRYQRDRLSVDTLHLHVSPAAASFHAQLRQLAIQLGHPLARFGVVGVAEQQPLMFDTDLPKLVFQLFLGLMPCLPGLQHTGGRKQEGNRQQHQEHGRGDVIPTPIRRSLPEDDKVADDEDDQETENDIMHGRFVTTLGVARGRVQKRGIGSLYQW